MEQPLVGRVSYLNCLPVFQALETGLVEMPAEILADHPSRLNQMFREGRLQVTAISSIEYARQEEGCLVLPHLSISADGPVRSVALLSKIPIEKLPGKTISLTPYSATSVVLLQLLMKRFYHAEGNFFTRPAGSQVWWNNPDAALVIGDEALQAVHQTGEHYIYDLAEEWKRWTGRKMVFALWVARPQFAREHPARLAAIWQGMDLSKKWGQEHPGEVVERGRSLTNLPAPVLTDYFHRLQYDLDWGHLDGLMYFYRLALECGLLERAASLHIWGREDDRYYRIQSA
ncbi:MAG: menaquinone biosynthesis protein [Firmicutes bacterium]|nr:menaquinone biosynthesis protein [Bacillota bacterium]